MAKQGREQRRQAQRARRAAGPAAGVADRADRGLAKLIEGIVIDAAVKGRRVRHLDIEGFADLRESFIDRGFRWPSWCYLPAPLVGAGLGEEIAIDVNPALVSFATTVATVAAAWVPGRIAVRFDDDVVRVLMDTPLEHTIPAEVLQRLPAWGLYVDCPVMAPGAGFFVSMDVGSVTSPTLDQSETDELLLAIVREGDDGLKLLVTTLWLRPGATIGSSMAAQAEQVERHGRSFLQASEEEWATMMGMGRAEAISRMLSLVLYLCSDDSDLTRRQVPSTTPGTRALGGEQTTVIAAGFRLGAALRTAAEAYASTGVEGSGHRVAPHLRRRPLAPLLGRQRGAWRPPPQAALGLADLRERRSCRGDAYRRSFCWRE